MSSRSRRGSLGVYNSYLPNPVDSMSVSRAASSAPPAPSSGAVSFYGPGSQPMSAAYYASLDKSIMPSYSKAHRLKPHLRDPERSNASTVPSDYLGQSAHLGTNATVGGDGSHALWHTRRGSLNITREKILSSLTGDTNTPKNRHTNSKTPAAAANHPRKTWIQNSRSPRAESRYSDSISKGMDQRVQGMLMGKRQNIIQNTSRSTPPPPSSPPPPGQLRVQASGDNVKHAIIGISGRVDSQALHLDISSNVDNWLRSNADEDVSLSEDIPLNENGQTLDFEQYQAWSKEQEKKQRRAGAMYSGTEKTSLYGSANDTEKMHHSDTKPKPQGEPISGSLATFAPTENAMHESAIGPLEALRQVHQLAKETLVSFGKSEIDSIQQKLAGIVVLCERGIERAGEI